MEVIDAEAVCWAHDFLAGQIAKGKPAGRPPALYGGTVGRVQGCGYAKGGGRGGGVGGTCGGLNGGHGQCAGGGDGTVGG